MAPVKSIRPRRAAWTRRDDGPRHRERRDEHREGDPVQPGAGQHLEDRTRDHEPDRGARRRCPHDQPVACGDAPGGLGVADDAHRQRDQAQPHALQDLSGSQQGDVRGDRGEQGAQADDREHAQQDGPLVTDIGQTSHQWSGDRTGQQQAGEDPRDLRRRGAHRVLDRGQGCGDSIVSSVEYANNAAVTTHSVAATAARPGEGTVVIGNLRLGASGQL